MDKQESKQEQELKAVKPVKGLGGRYYSNLLKKGDDKNGVKRT